MIRFDSRPPKVKKLVLTAMASMFLLTSLAQASDPPITTAPQAVTQCLALIRERYIKVKVGTQDEQFTFCVTTDTIKSSVLIEPYFVLEGMLGVLAAHSRIPDPDAAQATDDLNMVADFLTWYANHIQLQNKIQDTPTTPYGVAHVYEGTPDDPPVKSEDPLDPSQTQAYDSIDSYAGLFILACARYYKSRHELPSAPSVKQGIIISLNALGQVINQKPTVVSDEGAKFTFTSSALTNGLSIARGRGATHYLLDNVETYAGLRESAELFKIINPPANTPNPTILANSIAGGARSFDHLTDNKRYAYAIDNSDWPQFVSPDEYKKNPRGTDALSNLAALSYLPSKGTAQDMQVWQYLKDNYKAGNLDDDAKPNPAAPGPPAAPSERWLIAATRVAPSEAEEFRQTVIANVNNFGDITGIDRLGVTILALLDGDARYPVLNDSSTVTWQATDLAVGGDNLSRLLWVRPDKAFAVWTLTPSNAITSTPRFGPITGVSAAAMAAGGSDLKSRVLLNSTDNKGIAWTVQNPATGNITSTPAYGPFSGFTCREIATAPNNTTRLLWVRSDNSFSVWTVDASGNFTSTPAFGPIAGWSASAISVGGDNKTTVLLNNIDGRATVWTVQNPATGTITSTPAYGPFNGFACRDLATGSDNKTRLLWVRSDAGFAVWTVNTAGNFTSTPAYGPFSGWNESKVAVGGDLKARVLLNNVDGSAAVWTIDSAGHYTSTPALGPIVASNP